MTFPDVDGRRNVIRRLSDFVDGKVAGFANTEVNENKRCNFPPMKIMAPLNSMHGFSEGGAGVRKTHTHISVTMSVNTLR